MLRQKFIDLPKLLTFNETEKVNDNLRHQIVETDLDHVDTE